MPHRRKPLFPLSWASWASWASKINYEFFVTPARFATNNVCGSGGVRQVLEVYAIIGATMTVGLEKAPTNMPKLTQKPEIERAALGSAGSSFRINVYSRQYGVSDSAEYEPCGCDGYWNSA